MTIAINLTSFISGGRKDLIYTQFEKLALSRPEDQFIVIVSKEESQDISPAANITLVKTGIIVNTKLSWKFWYDYTLQKILRKYQASILINTDGACSLRSTIPQCLYLTEVDFIDADERSHKKMKGYLQKHFPQFLTKASIIITTSQYLKEQISRKFLSVQEKMVNVPIIVNPEYQPLNWEIKETIKDKYAEGKEFFLYNGEMDQPGNIINLLKAFTHFKRRQKSNMQLLITTHSPAQNTIVESLQTYKYRNEVKLLFDLPHKEVAEITAAAYAFVYPVLQDNFPVVLLQALLCGTPLIVSNTPIFREISGEAAVYVDPPNIGEIAENMMLLFKNERQRNEMIQESQGLAAEIKQVDSADVLWKAIVQSMQV
jgi:glycosyltransferase involved in cell wall biosynthesis